MFDVKCYELAEAFMADEDGVIRDLPGWRARTDELAQLIQDTIEQQLEYWRNHGEAEAHVMAETPQRPKFTPIDVGRLARDIAKYAAENPPVTREQAMRTLYGPAETDDALDWPKELTPMMAETPQTANYIEERDVLAEAGRILRGETKMIATIEHLQAVMQLLRVAYAHLDCEYRDGILCDPGEAPPSILDWLTEADKILKS